MFDDSLSWTDIDERAFKEALDLAQEARRRVEAYDTQTHHHGVRVAQWATLMAQRLPSFDRRRLRVLEISAMLHDYGKLMIPLEILNKPGKLDDHEFSLIKKHPEVGAMTAPVNPDFVEKGAILWHHKWFNGKGYPAGNLSGHAIPIEARITAVADVFDAITSSRLYHAGGVGTEPYKAIEYMKQAAGTQLDPALVTLFQTIYEDSKQGADGEVGIPTLTASSVIMSEANRVRHYIEREIGEFDPQDPISGSHLPDGLVDRLIQVEVRANLDEYSARNIVLHVLRLPLSETFCQDDLAMDQHEYQDAVKRAGNHQEAVLYIRNDFRRLSYMSIVVFQQQLWFCIAEQAGDRNRISLIR
jgi:hypothetical protein